MQNKCMTTWVSMTANTFMYWTTTRNTLPANSAVEAVMIGWAAILVDITPGARVPGAKVPAAIVGKATKPAVPTMEVITVLPAIVIAGTEKRKTKSTCHNKDYIYMVEPSQSGHGKMDTFYKKTCQYITDRRTPLFKSGHFLKLDSCGKHFLMVDISQRTQLCSGWPSKK